jgi:predicted AAA+ superfamily ATPase
LLKKVEQQRGRHFSGIMGPRGVGKTVMLKQLLSESSHAFYLSLDTLPRDADIFGIVKKLHRDYGYTLFLLDEIHFSDRVEETLKKLYDFLDIRLVFTSSVALALSKSAFDLSRRALMLTLYPFSFREYLLFTQGIDLKVLSLEQVVRREWLPEHMRNGLYFDDYLKGGLMPFALDEPEPLRLLSNILETVIMKDVPTVARLHLDELDSIRKLVRFIGRSGVDGINYTTLSNNLGITKYKAEQYIGLLEKAFILQRVFPKGTNLLKEPKVLMALPYRLLFREYDECVGGLREDFFSEAMRQCDQPFFYLKSTRGKKTPDFLIDDGLEQNTVIEIGGKGKGREQFKGIVADRKIVFAHSDAIDHGKHPLFMLGYLA